VQSPSSFELLAARFHRVISPVARTEIADVYTTGRGLLAAEPEAARLFELNFRTKARLLALGSCYAVDVAPQLVAPLVAVTVRWGALFTLIDTAIDEGGIVDRAICERLAAWLVAPLAAPDPRAAPPTSFERVLARLCFEIHDVLRSLDAFPRFAEAVLPLLERHARLVVFQHLPADEREAWLRDAGVADYLALCADGSPGPLFALLRAAFSLGAAFDARARETVERLYFPEFGLLHVWVDDLADYDDDDGRKDLNLARRAAASGRAPGAALLALLEGYLRRLEGLPDRDQISFPLRLMIEEYFEQARRVAGDARGLVIDTFRAAVGLVRGADLAPPSAAVAS
jgi:hypothetical protein